jgi:signal transduction histidine kinase
MLPYLHILHLNVPTFGLMLWLAAVAAAFIMDRDFRRARITADAVSIVAIAVVLGIVGAKLWHVIDTPAEFRDEGWRVLWDSAGFAWFFRAGGRRLEPCASWTWLLPRQPSVTALAASAASFPETAATASPPICLGA